MKKFSNNPKYNAVANEIYNDLLNIHDSEKESREEIEHYKREFPREPDFNLAQYGNLLIYYYDIREMFARCGYSNNTMKSISNSPLWEMY